MPHWLKRLLSLSPAPASKQGSLNYNHPQGRHVGPFHSLTIVTHNKEHLKRVIRLLINHSICETICHNSQHIVWFLKIPYFLLPYLFSSFFFLVSPFYMADQRLFGSHNLRTYLQYIFLLYTHSHSRQVKCHDRNVANPQDESEHRQHVFYNFNLSSNSMILIWNEAFR